MSTTDDQATKDGRAVPVDSQPAAGSHQTISRVTRILEEVVYRPGSTFAELTRAVGAPKSSVYGFVRGLLSVDWLIEQDHRLYLGPAFFSLAIASGHIRAGSVTAGDLESLNRETGLAAFVGVRAGDHLLYVAEAGSDLLTAAGGKILLAELPEAELEAFLRRRGPEEQPMVDEFLGTRASIRSSGVAVNHNRTLGRTGVATAIRNATGTPIAAVTLLGPDSDVVPRINALGELLLKRVGEWRLRSSSSREPI